jgi:hypothetical protein
MVSNLVAVPYKPQEDRFAGGCIAFAVLLKIALGTAPKADRLAWSPGDGLVAARPAPPSI